MNKVVNLRKDLEGIIIRLQEFDGLFHVIGASIYGTRQGGRVGGTRERKFTTLDAAREYANNWYSDLVNQGWRRI